MNDALTALGRRARELREEIADREAAMARSRADDRRATITYDAGLESARAERRAVGERVQRELEAERHARAAERALEGLG